MYPIGTGTRVKNKSGIQIILVLKVLRQNRIPAMAAGCLNRASEDAAAVENSEDSARAGRIILAALSRVPESRST